MELEKLRKSMKNILSESRYLHTLGVEEVCYDLALINHEDTLRASIAGILHDCAKHMYDEDFIIECKHKQIKISDTERKLPHLLHARLGAIYANEKYGIIDKDIINAIEYHTTGRPAMSKLEKILFVADYIEPGRKHISKLYEIRKVAYNNMDQALIMILKTTLEYLNKSGSIIDSRTLETYKYYVNRNKEINTFI